MRCIACDKLLSDFEATRRSAITDEFTDLCNHCFASISEDLHTIERSDLAHDEDTMTVDDDTINHCGLDIDRDY